MVNSLRPSGLDRSQCWELLSTLIRVPWLKVHQQIVEEVQCGKPGNGFDVSDDIGLIFSISMLIYISCIVLLGV